MGFELLDLKSAAAHLHMKENELKHFAQRGEVPSSERSGTFFFEHRALDEWAQRRLLSISDKELSSEHRLAMTERRQAEARCICTFWPGSACWCTAPACWKRCARPPTPKRCMRRSSAPKTTSWAPVANAHQPPTTNHQPPATSH